MKCIRQATAADLPRIAEMVVFNYRLNFYPIFRDDDFYFNEMQVLHLADAYRKDVGSMWVYDDGAVKGFVQVADGEIKKLFVEPVLQGRSIGAALLDFAVSERHVDNLWALEKNTRAIRFYERHGFHQTEDRKPEEGTSEYLVRMKR